MAGDGSSHKLRWSEKKVTQKRRGGNRIRLERVDSGGGGGLVCVCVCVCVRERKKQRKKC